jgi:hypothetical protein
MKLASVMYLALATSLVMARSASADVNPGEWRYWIDVDVLSGGTVTTDPSGAPPKLKTRVFSLGPNQLGNSRVAVPITPLGLGVAYVLKPKWLLGMRTGLGFDHLSPKDGPSQNYLAFSFMPELTFVPLGDSAKLFVKFSPVLQYNRQDLGSTSEHIFMGCFSFGLGTFVFMSKTSSMDVGAYFEGRFGDIKGESGGGIDVNDLRGVLRGGISLWR